MAESVGQIRALAAKVTENGPVELQMAAICKDAAAAAVVKKAAGAARGELVEGLKEADKLVDKLPEATRADLKAVLATARTIVAEAKTQTDDKVATLTAAQDHDVIGRVIQKLILAQIAMNPKGTDEKDSEKAK
jgi:hypothetical protein